jgi:hypothetical protein
MLVRSNSPRGSVVTIMLCLSLLWAAGTPLAHADDASRAAKIAELMRLTGLARMLAESKVTEQAAARKMVQSMSEQMFAKFPAIPPEERARIEGATRQFQRDVDNGSDQDAAVRTWGRLYSQNLTDADLDAILAFYRSPVGQKDVTATGAALPQFQHYIIEKNAAVMNAAVANYTAALRSIVDSSTADGAAMRGASNAGAAKAGAATAGAVTAGAGTATGAMAGPAAAGASNAGAEKVDAVTPGTAMVGPGAIGAVTAGSSATPESPARRWDSNPTAPNGLVIPNPPPSERCEVTPPTPVGAHAVPPSGRSLLCVCIDEKGTLTRDPVIAESSGDSRVDSGAVKMARSDSGRYEPPIVDGQPQRACFRFAIDFEHQQ